MIEISLFFLNLNPSSFLFGQVILFPCYILYLKAELILNIRIAHNIVESPVNIDVGFFICKFVEIQTYDPYTPDMTGSTL